MSSVQRPASSDLTSSCSDQGPLSPGPVRAGKAGKAGEAGEGRGFPSQPLFLCFSFSYISFSFLFPFSFSLLFLSRINIPIYSIYLLDCIIQYLPYNTVRIMEFFFYSVCIFNYIYAYKSVHLYIQYSIYNTVHTAQYIQHSTYNTIHIYSPYNSLGPHINSEQQPTRPAEPTCSSPDSPTHRHTPWFPSDGATHTRHGTVRPRSETRRDGCSGDGMAWLGSGPFLFPARAAGEAQHSTAHRWMLSPVSGRVLYCNALDMYCVHSPVCTVCKVLYVRYCM